MKTTTTLEEMHFSGTHAASMTVRILEKVPGHDPQATMHKLEIDHGAVVGLPLGTAAMARYIGEAIIRTAERMESQPRAGGKYPEFRRFGLADVISVRAGLRLRPVYEHTTVRGHFSTGSDILGVDWLDDEDNVVRFEPMERQQHHGTHGAGEEPWFLAEEIGLPLYEVTRKPIHPNQREFTTTTHRYVVPGGDPALIEPPSREIIDQIVHGLPKDADEFTIQVAIRTFYALPGRRKDREWREDFARTLCAHLGWETDAVTKLIARTRAR